MKDSETMRQSIFKIFYRIIFLAILASLFSSYTVFAASKVANKSATATSSKTTNKEYTPEERKLRLDWGKSMIKKPAPTKGCFRAHYPNTEWKKVPCVPIPNDPYMPKEGPRPFVGGGGNSILAQAPSGTITTAIGSFENIMNVTSESGLLHGTGTPVNNAYSLQLNTNFMTTPACAPSPNPACNGWEQWIFANTGTYGTAFMQYWLRRYDTTCPTDWITFPISGHTYCYRNNTAGGVTLPNEPITNIGSWRLRGTASAAGDSIAMTTLSDAITQDGDNFVNAAANWTLAEFNIYGQCCGSQANFNPGASINARTQIIYGDTAAPICVAGGTTGETNNLSFGPTPPTATTPGPALIFTESTAGGSPSNCAAAATIGDTHLHTFNGLLYDFQASGDFTLAKVAPGFEVQTRQKSGAPLWPNASVNKAVAARFGKTQVAICLTPNKKTASVLVNGKLTPVKDGQILELPENTALRRLGNVYQVVDEDGNSINAKVYSFIHTQWIDVSVGLGRWPSTVTGLIANANGNVNQIATRDGSVLTAPFKFDDLYHRFGDSWRVKDKESMLSVCNTETPVEHASPKKIFYAQDLKPDVRGKALATCTAAGVKPGPLMDACTLDVAVIGEDVAAKVFTNTTIPVAIGTIVTTNPGPLGPHWWPWILLLIIILIILWWLIRRSR